MKNHSTSSKTLLVAIVVLFAVASATAIGKNRWWAQPAKASSSAVIPGPVASTLPVPQTPSGEMREAVLVKLSTKGFEPQEITRPAGKFLLGITNRTGLPELSIRLTNESRRSVAGKQLGQGMSWHRVIDLPPGRYALREANHPDWVCRITITAP